MRLRLVHLQIVSLRTILLSIGHAGIILGETNLARLKRLNETQKKRSIMPEPGPLLERTVAGEGLYLFLRAHRLVSDWVDNELRDVAGLSLPLWEVLIVLSKAPEMRLRMLDITTQILVSKSNVTQLVDKLVRMGMVRRELSDLDRRLVYAVLTVEGIDAVQRCGDIFNQAAQKHFARYLSGEEMERLATGLAKIVSANAN
jgi:DNA-binding MarR family transcriptional regulator